MRHVYHRKVKHYLRWALIHASLVLFFADLIAAVWPAFNVAWSRLAHLGVAFAAFAAFLTEHWLTEEIDKLEDEAKQ